MCTNEMKDILDEAKVENTKFRFQICGRVAKASSLEL